MLMPTSCSHTDALALADILDRYAGRFCSDYDDRRALMKRTLAALAHDPEALQDERIDRAILSKMHQVFLSDLEPSSIVAGITIGMEKPV